MLIIYRPYISHTRTAKSLHKTDIAKMKLDAYIMIKIISEKMGWIPRTKTSNGYKNDIFVKFYYNNGKPYMDCLLEYYYNIYLEWLKNHGEEYDWCEELNGIYEDNVKQCKAGDPWRKSHALMHKMYLLKHDYKWYKRHFRMYYIYNINSYELIKGKKPRKLFKKDLIKFRERLQIDEMKI